MAMIRHMTSKIFTVKVPISPSIVMYDTMLIMIWFDFRCRNDFLVVRVYGETETIG